MNIKSDIKKVLAESGMSVTELARLSDVNQSILSRFVNGKQKGLHSDTLEKLWPFIYGDKRPDNPNKAA